MQPLTIAKLKKISIITTILIFALGYMFVTTTLNENEIKVQEKNRKNEDVVEEKPVKVTLIVDGSPFFGTQAFKQRMQNTNTILDLLEILRENKQFNYERTFYTYGVEIDSINGFTAPNDGKWAMFITIGDQKSVDDLKNNLKLNAKEEEVLNNALVEGVDIATKMGDLNLLDGATYEIRLIHNEVLQ